MDVADVHLHQLFLIIVSFLVVFRELAIVRKPLLINKDGIFRSDRLIAGAGFEPATSGLWARRATRLLYPAGIILNSISRGSPIVSYLNRQRANYTQT